MDVSLQHVHEVRQPQHRLLHYLIFSRSICLDQCSERETVNLSFLRTVNYEVWPFYQRVDCSGIVQTFCQASASGRFFSPIKSIVFGKAASSVEFPIGSSCFNEIFDPVSVFSIFYPVILFCIGNCRVKVKSMQTASYLIKCFWTILNKCHKSSFR